MKIVFAIKSLTVEGGGAEKVLVEVANGLHCRGHDIHILTFDFQGDTFYLVNPEIPRLAMAFNSPGTSTSPISFIRAIPRIRRTIRRINPDITVAFMHSTYIPLAIAIKGLGYPLVISEHTEMRHYKGRILQNYLRKIIDSSSIVRTVPTKTVLSGFEGESFVQTVVIPNPVTFKNHAYSSPSQTKENIVLSVGRLMEEKDHSTLISAFSKVADEFPYWRLLIIGDGPLQEQLKNQIKHLALTNHIKLLGTKRNMAYQYAKSEFVVLPSRYESFGMVAAEALASGKPVLGFDDCAGISEIIQVDFNGLLVPGHKDISDRVDSLASGLTKLMSDKNLRIRLGENGPLSVKKYNIQAILDRWEQVLNFIKLDNLSKLAKDMPNDNGEDL